MNIDRKRHLSALQIIKALNLKITPATFYSRVKTNDITPSFTRGDMVRPKMLFDIEKMKENPLVQFWQDKNKMEWQPVEEEVW